MTTLDLWQQYVSTRDPTLRDALVQRHLPLVRQVVGRMRVSAWGCISQEDLVNHAIVGLIDATDRFDPALGVEFEAFAMRRIRGAVLDAIRDLDWAPRSVRRTQAQMERAFAVVQARLGRSPTDEEVAGELGVDLRTYDRMVAEVARGGVLSLDESVTDDGEGDVLGDLVPDPAAANPVAHTERAIAEAQLCEALRLLPERERLILSLYYYEEMTFKEIGRTLGVTEQRASQLHARAVMRLRGRLQRHAALLSAL
ncbi:MAG: FliA/WhiG family RNA polymerase sigma factor [Armatimonadetes bacterium]|nr:FliA/WhiG family RNA polymerase sigma factor [Armatimonadota bacterium]